ncbi:hypothetical protein ES703_27375 [subsurface metagenome]
MEERSILERNLLALSVNNPELCCQLSSAGPSMKITFIASQRGSSVPALLSGGQRPTPFHSTVDPVKEGRRFLKLFQGAGYLVFLGIGGGYHITPFLEAKRVSRILLVDKDPEVLRAVLERIDLSSVLLDPRVRLQIGSDAEELQRFILSDYVPAIDGDLITVPLRAVFDSDRKYFQEVLSSIESLIGKIADDYTVQSQFGKKWFVNTLANLQAAERSTICIKPVRKAIVTGAGPSLELQIGELRRLKPKGFVIASDTSLPALLQYDIKPDLVLSIDCQQVSYHHFLQGMPNDIPLVLDLASPPVLTRLSEKTIFFSSGHPFSQYVTSSWRKFPFIDTSGGNVSHAAVSLALFLGAEEIYLLGADFSFPEGKSYCRGTYIYPLFRAQENRVRPLESLFFSFILKNNSIIKERVQGALRYTTLPMISYKERLENYLKSSSAVIIPLSGKGVPLNLPRRVDRKKNSIIGSILSAGAPKTDWRQFLQNYLLSVESLPEPYYPLSKYFSELSDEEQNLWITQYPAVATLRETPGKTHLEGTQLLKSVRKWSVSVIRRYLEK